ncbi:DNA polymerase III subunit epsilon [Flavobacterium noncentrifugens]|uniref:DNA polymerase-3 subunit epsilon n=1 Tax=Flavobacterium noncentrifugens TaxID=1128970 RepID=A0A1G8ZRC5_9FLAO|nr:exonuclease domain-containing protein [Flavobacterium noncentrifugens]GEP51859.1 DNA polymerase III subunit epsilon [Flavobacterium noncentrifugens]SDK17662.1 DNA polymerase-3 subunit epsilon [Flavobacterium noncentrifugens]
MFDWIKNINKDYPEFYKNYISKFEKKSPRIVVLSLDTTGLDPEKDVILSFGAVGIQNNSILVSDNFEIVLLQYKYLHDNGLSNEFIIESKQPKLGEREGVQAFIEYIGNAVLVGHRIHFDVAMINEALVKMDCGRLKNEALDVEIMHQKLTDNFDKSVSVDELLNIYKVSKSDRYSSAEDAYNMALLFLKLKARLGL